MRKIRELTRDEIADAVRVIQIAGADAERSLFLVADRARTTRLSELREGFHAYVEELIEIRGAGVISGEKVDWGSITKEMKAIDADGAG